MVEGSALRLCFCLAKKHLVSLFIYPRGVRAV